MKTNILDILKEKGNRGSEEVARMVIKNNELVQELIQGVSDQSKRVKNASIKTLAIISKNEPKFLYPYCRFFINLINSADKILKWNAIDIVSNLSYVDSDNMLTLRILKKYFALLSDEVMITAAHSVDNLWKFAINKSEFQKNITSRLLKIDTIERNPECKNIIIGKTIIALTKYFHLIKDRNSIISFVKRHQNNSRSGTRKKAEEFLKKYYN